ncbi:hypothetical protein DPV78_012419 [Talaromyces pinophilus]|nr:hypothetical protein DPV78_012419 [Talaromyces pinophilus]
MADSDGTSMASSNENLPDPLPFGAIGFFEGEPDSANPTHIRLEEDLNKTTLGKGRSFESPLVIKTGKYYIVLYYAEESPSVVRKDNGRDRKRYDCKRWRFDLGTDTATEGDGKVNIAVKFKSLNDSIIRMETANLEPSPNECVPLKVVEFNKSNKFEVTVIGKVHLLFAERYLQKFKGGNLMCYVDLMDNQ